MVTLHPSEVATGWEGCRPRVFHRSEESHDPLICCRLRFQPRVPPGPWVYPAHGVLMTPPQGERRRRRAPFRAPWHRRPLHSRRHNQLLLFAHPATGASEAASDPILWCEEMYVIGVCEEWLPTPLGRHSESGDHLPPLAGLPWYALSGTVG